MNHKNVVNSKAEPYDVYIGRPSKWGNPFSHLKSELAEYRVHNRHDSIQKYAHWIIYQEELLDDIHELDGKVLGCFCDPEPCHGSILSLLAEYMYGELEEHEVDIESETLVNDISILLRGIKTPIVVEGDEEFKKLVAKIIKHINTPRKEKIYYIRGEDGEAKILHTKNTP